MAIWMTRWDLLRAEEAQKDQCCVMSLLCGAGSRKEERGDYSGENHREIGQ